MENKQGFQCVQRYGFFLFAFTDAMSGLRSLNITCCKLDLRRGTRLLEAPGRAAANCNFLTFVSLPVTRRPKFAAGENPYRVGRSVGAEWERSLAVNLSSPSERVLCTQ